MIRAPVLGQSGAAEARVVGHPRDPMQIRQARQQIRPGIGVASGASPPRGPATNQQVTRQLHHHHPAWVRDRPANQRTQSRRPDQLWLGLLQEGRRMDLLHSKML